MYISCHRLTRYSHEAFSHKSLTRSHSLTMTLWPSEQNIKSARDDSNWLRFIYKSAKSITSTKQCQLIYIETQFVFRGWAWSLSLLYNPRCYRQKYIIYWFVNKTTTKFIQNQNGHNSRRYKVVQDVHVQVFTLYNTQQHQWIVGKSVIRWFWHSIKHKYVN